ncbi:MAG: DUF6765 family protein [bacterium]
MKMDYHYGVIYYLALCCGFKDTVAYEIAYSSQMVDDANYTRELTIKDFKGQTEYAFEQILTSYDMLSEKNIEFESQMETWLPFHFVPGCEGHDFMQFTVTRPDNKLINEVFEKIIEREDKYGNINMLFGIFLHAYADTWAHQDFNAFTSRINKDELADEQISRNDNLIMRKFKETMMHFQEKFCTGHADLDVLPDIPFIEFTYKKKQGNTGSIYVNNQERFMKAANQVYNKMIQFAGKHPELCDRTPKPFEAIDGLLEHFLSNEAENAEYRNKDILDKIRRMDKLSKDRDVKYYDNNEWFEISKKNDFSTDSPWIKWQMAANTYRKDLLNEFNHHLHQSITQGMRFY